MVLGSFACNWFALPNVTVQVMKLCGSTKDKMTVVSAFQHMQYTKFRITIDMLKLSLSIWLQLKRNGVRAETFIRYIWLHITRKTDGAKSMDILQSVSSIVAAQTINVWKIDCLHVFGSHGMSSLWQLCYELTWTAASVIVWNWWYMTSVNMYATSLCSHATSPRRWTFM